jgi:protein gp37
VQLPPSHWESWNPVTGCTKVSEGCRHCYAERFAERWRGIPGHHYEYGFDLRLRPERLELPLHWRSPRRVFVTSMGDLFHGRIPDDYVREVFAVMERAPQHVFHVLTKRADRMLELAPLLPWPPNIWMGVTVERMDYAARADELRRVPAARRHISAEPLLGPLGALDLTGIDLVIAGGESGARPRPPAAAAGLAAKPARPLCRRRRRLQLQGVGRPRPARRRPPARRSHLGRRAAAGRAARRLL